MSQDIFRVYRREWVIINVTTRLAADASDEAMMAAARAFYVQWYAGRVYEQDVQFVTVGQGPHARVQLELRMPNLQAEWKTWELAQHFVTEQGWTDATVVERNSRADHDLRGYGLKLLASP